MSKKSKKSKSNRRVSARPPTQPQQPQQHQPQQTRDALRIARAQARRSADIVKRRIESLRRLEVEDLRRDTYDRAQLPVRTYRREDGGQAYARWHEVHTPDMRRQGMPSQVRYSFDNPRSTVVCIRRAARRATLFGLQQIGRAGAGAKSYARWTDRSTIQCRKLGR